MPKGRKEGGKAEHKVTPKTEALVYSMTQAGCTVDDMCVALSRDTKYNAISKPTFYKYYADIRLAAQAEARDAVGTVALEMAKSGDQPGMTKWWLERRGGDEWKPPKDDGLPPIAQYVFNIGEPLGDAKEDGTNDEAGN